MTGPPFSVTGIEVRALFAHHFRIEHRRTLNILDENPRFRHRGLSVLQEKVYRLVQL